MFFPLPAGFFLWRESKIPDLIWDVLARVYYGGASPGLRPGQAGPIARYSNCFCCIAWLGQPGCFFACAAGTHFFLPNQVRDLRLDKIEGPYPQSKWNIPKAFGAKKSRRSKLAERSNSEAPKSAPGPCLRFVAKGASQYTMRASGLSGKYYKATVIIHISW
jgi:hypothetical protein